MGKLTGSKKWGEGEGKEELTCRKEKGNEDEEGRTKNWARDGEFIGVGLAG